MTMRIFTPKENCKSKLPLVHDNHDGTDDDDDDGEQEYNMGRKMRPQLTQPQQLSHNAAVVGKNVSANIFA